MNYKIFLKAKEGGRNREIKIMKASNFKITDRGEIIFKDGLRAVGFVHADDVEYIYLRDAGNNYINL